MPVGHGSGARARSQCGPAGVRPASASSSRSNCGSVASARAISSRLRPGVPRLRAGARRSEPRPGQLDHRAPRRALARCAVAQKGADHDVLETRASSSNVAGTWKVRAMPSRACSSGARPGHSAPSNRIVPAVGMRSPARQLKKVDLPAPFGPISPMISPSATPGRRDHGSERPRTPSSTARLKQRAVRSRRLAGGAGEGVPDADSPPGRKRASER